MLLFSCTGCDILMDGYVAVGRLVLHVQSHPVTTPECYVCSGAHETENYTYYRMVDYDEFINASGEFNSAFDINPINVGFWNFTIYALNDFVSSLDEITADKIIDEKSVRVKILKDQPLSQGINFN